jgi:mono/diheme cytochrome c family protein
MNRLAMSIVILLIMLSVAAPAPASEGHIEEEVPSEIRALENPIQMTKASVENGMVIYEKNCAGCHGETGRGDGPLAGDLPEKPTDFTDTEMTKDHTEGELFYKTKEGVGEYMPAYEDELTEEEIWHLVNYMKSIAGEAADQEEPPITEEKETALTASPEEFRTIKNPVLNDHTSFKGGKEVYRLYCYRCHGSNGQGNNGSYARSVLTEQAPDLSDPALLSKRTDGELFYTIKFGSGEMLAHVKYLHDEEIWQSVNYIRTFEGMEHDTTEDKGSGTTLYFGILLVALVLTAYFVKRRR